MEKENNYMVCVRCFTFNQAQYIEDALNGFCMQQTNFPFVCVIVDDASVDGEPGVISNYLERHFNLDDTAIVRREETDDYQMVFAKHKDTLNCFFAVYYLKYNHYSIRKSKFPYLTEWLNKKYEALCEGDDYWTDPFKLQKQVDFMESHPDCSLCFHANNNLYSSGIMKEYHPRKRKRFYSAVDVILGGGDFMATNSMFYRLTLLDENNKPDFWKKAPIGDGPCMLYFASKGKIGYIDDVMSVYRKNSVGSWTSRQDSFDAYKRHYILIQKMFDEYDQYTNRKYHFAIVVKKIRNGLSFYKNVLINKLK